MADLTFRIVTTLRIEEEWTIQVPDVEVALPEQTLHDIYNATVIKEAEWFYEQNLARSQEFLRAFIGPEPVLLDASVEVQFISKRGGDDADDL